MQDENNMPQPVKKRADAIQDEEIAKALMDHNGLQYLAADALKLSYWHLSKRINESEYLKLVRDHCLEKRKDIYEQKLDKLAEKEELGAICFFLKTRAKDRGYAETSQVIVDAILTQRHDSIMDQITNLQSSRKIDNTTSINE